MPDQLRKRAGVFLLLPLFANQIAGGLAAIRDFEDRHRPASNLQFSKLAALVSLPNPNSDFAIWCLGRELINSPG